jgi:hypothetical protein
MDQESLISTMLDVCRPEIENAARPAFLADPSAPLKEAQRSAAAQTLALDKSIVGAPYGKFRREGWRANGAIGTVREGTSGSCLR